jgi:carboxyl-terminal processing protease
VTWRQLPGTSLAHLHIANFNKGVSEDLRKSLSDIAQREMQGLILDLRDNPGGLLREAVAGASQFLQGGDVVQIKNARGDIKPIAVDSGGIATKITMAVLVNGGTASASEIVAGALQDAGRAILVGDKTFGTGTVLSEFGLSDGSALLLAVEEWLTPGGHTIWHKGIVPNMVVALPQDAGPLFPESEESRSATQLRGSVDKQLLRAMQVLGR